MAEHPEPRPKGSTRSRRRGQVVERRTGVWLVRAYAGTDPQRGKRRDVSKVVRGTRKDADRALAEILRKLDHGYLGAGSGETVEQFVGYWLDHVKLHHVEPQTVCGYRYNLTRYVFPVVGSVRLRDLRVRHLQALISELRGRNLSGRTVRLTFAPLRDALNRAVAEGRIEVNPAKLVDLRGHRAARVRATALEVDQLRTFIAKAEIDRRGLIFVVMVSTGLRPGELMALRWADVDLDERLLRVERALARVPGESGWHFKVPKTEAGRRTVVLDETAMRALRLQRRRQAEDRLAVGPDWQDHDLVFATEIGTPMSISNVVRRDFKRLLDVAAIPRTFRLYDLRHTYGTRLIAEGVDPKTVAELMGHANVSLTLGTYTHPGVEQKRRAVAKLEEVFSGVNH